MEMREQRTTDDGEPLDWGRDEPWDPDLPEAPNGFLEDATLTLRKVEAEYLYEKLRIHCDRSMLPFLIEAGDRLDQVKFAWMHPSYASFPAWLRETLHHARLFSEAMYGAALLYNFMLAQLDGRSERADEYRAELQSWRGELQARRGEFLAWDQQRFWQLIGRHGLIPIPTRQFVDAWLRLILETSETPRVEDSESARGLVRRRETYLKRGRSRFTSKRHRELWGGASGSFQLDFRWWVARRLANDIIEGLRGE